MILLQDKGILLRFLLVGIVNTGFGVGTYWLLLYLGLTYQWASLFSLILSLFFSFNSHRLGVFKVKGGFFRYVLVSAFIYSVNIELITIIRDYTGDYFAAIAVLPVNVSLSFILMKYFVFRREKEYGIS
jgi:putative flippase GtrA